MTLTLEFDLHVKNFNLGCYLVMVAARRASLSSDNSYLLAYLPCKSFANLEENVTLSKLNSVLCFISQDIQNRNRKNPNLVMIEKKVDEFLQHWRARIGLEKNKQVELHTCMDLNKQFYM